MLRGVAKERLAVKQSIFVWSRRLLLFSLHIEACILQNEAISLPFISNLIVQQVLSSMTSRSLAVLEEIKHPFEKLEDRKLVDRKAVSLDCDSLSDYVSGTWVFRPCFDCDQAFFLGMGFSCKRRS